MVAVGDAEDAGDIVAAVAEQRAVADVVEMAVVWFVA